MTTIHGRAYTRRHCRISSAKLDGRNIRETTVTAEIFSIRSEDPHSLDAQILLDELTAMNSLFGRVGGRRPFARFALPGRSILLLVRDSTGVSFGCGAFVPETNYVAEITGPYCQFDREEINDALLRRLEKSAAQFGFVALNVEVSEKNRRMVAFFLARGFLTRTTSDNEPSPVGVRCFQKRLRQEAGCLRSLFP
jgi:hypothetical protein